MKYNMTGKSKLMMMMLITVLCMDAASQNSQVLYYMNLPQNHFLNPAMRPSNKLYIGLPGISGINLNINNNFLNFKDVFFKGQPIDSIAFLQKDFDVENFLSGIGDYNFLKPEASVQLFGLGFSAGKDLYIFLDYNVRLESNFRFPGDLFKLALFDQNSLAGNSFDLSNLRIDEMVYNEFGLGFSKNITEKFRIGVKGKLLLGLEAMNLKPGAFKATIGSDYSQDWNADLMMNISAPVTISWDADHKPKNFDFDSTRFSNVKSAVKNIFSTGNKGFGLDFGAVYSFSDKFSISAAITDLGFINWEKDITNVRAVSQFTFDAGNILDIYAGTMDFDSLSTVFLDSLMNSMTFTDTKNPFTTKLTYGVNAGFKYNVSKGFSIGVLSNTRFMEDHYQEAVTLSANVNLGNALSASFGYTATNYRYDNLGLGLALRLGCFQLYALADRIPLPFSSILMNQTKEIPVPEIWSTLHARVGLNLCFGNKIRQKADKPMVLVQ
jgi:hypothetical protein